MKTIAWKNKVVVNSSVQEQGDTGIAGQRRGAPVASSLSDSFFSA